MEAPKTTDNTVEIEQIDWTQRWQAYRRLQELSIPCWCATNRPLRVELSSFHAMIQLDSVLRQLTRNHRELASWLEGCLQLDSYQLDSDK